MVPEKITNKLIDEMCYYLEYYDLNGRFPFDKKPVLFNLSSSCVDMLGDVKNKSLFVENLILRKNRNI